MSTKENRRSFRVHESIYVKYDLLTEEEFEAGLSHYKVRQGPADGASSMLVDIEARLSEAMFMLKGEHASTALRATKNDLTNSAPQDCEVSADSLCFGSERPLTVGDKLYLQFILSTDNRYVDTFCKVTRLTEPPNPDGGMPYGIVVEFVSMLPALREMLIQHMFGRESETLRMRRLELEAPSTPE